MWQTKILSLHPNTPRVSYEYGVQVTRQVAAAKWILLLHLIFFWTWDRFIQSSAPLWEGQLWRCAWFEHVTITFREWAVRSYQLGPMYYPVQVRLITLRLKNRIFFRSNLNPIQPDPTVYPFVDSQGYHQCTTGDNDDVWVLSFQTDKVGA